MTYEQTLHYLYNKLPLFSNIGKKAYKADLHNTLALCDHAGNPQKKIRTVHIAGTNGKGSTSHMLAAVFQQSGYKTGLYTSPHLKDFRERIRINGEMIPQDFVISFVEDMKAITAKIEPSFFELTFVMALEYFAHEKVDIAIIETGLGGRLDSTNVIVPVISVITNIGFDHVDILGDTLEKIAVEKAGIIKPQVPVVIGSATGDVKKVFMEKAIETGSAIYLAEESFSVLHSAPSHEKMEVQVLSTHEKSNDQYLLDLTGLYQLNNLLTVLTAIDVLKDLFHLPGKDIHEALAHVKNLTGLRGRWDIVHHHPLIALDVAHNVDGIRQLVRQVNNSRYKKLHIIFGMVKDKEIDKVLQLLPPAATYYFTRAQIPRALPENELLERAGAFHLHGLSYPDVNNALRAAMDAAAIDDMIIICGSTFIVGEVDEHVFETRQV
jgi:dihydrofolate synthase / folylpolyglutamate synthase